MLRGLLLALAFAASPLVAGPDRVSILLGSEHFGASGFEEFNPGAFLTWEAEPVHWSAGVFRNSYGRGSVAATGYLPLFEWGGGNAGVFAGLAHYPGDGRRFAISAGDVVPLAGLQARHKSAFVQIVPMDGKPVKALLSFGLTFEVGK